MSKKIIAISNHGRFMGGGEHSFYDLVSHLPLSYELVAVLPEFGDLSEKLLSRAVHCKILPLPLIRPWTLLKVMFALTTHYRFARFFKPGLIYANGSRAAFYGGIVGRRLGIPVVWHCRIVRPDPYLDWLLVKLCKVVIVNSRATADRFKSYEKIKPNIVYNGINLDLFNAPQSAEPDLIQKNWKVILSVARISRDKHHDIILKAFEQIAEKAPNRHLVFIGDKDSADPAWWDTLQQMSQQSVYCDQIHWVGHDPNLVAWYRSATLFVLATENESFGRVLVEAMACGLPIVATQSGGIPEIVRHEQEGFLVPVGDATALAEAVTFLLDHAAIRSRFADSGRQRARIFSLKNHLDQIMPIFENLLKP